MSGMPAAWMRSANGCRSPNHSMIVAGWPPGDKAAANPRPLGQGEFTLQPVRVAIAATNEAQPAARCRGCGEPAPRNQCHRRGENRMFYVEEFGEAGFQ